MRVLKQIHGDEPKIPHLIGVVWAHESDNRLKEAAMFLIEGPVTNEEFETLLINELYGPGPWEPLRGPFDDDDENVAELMQTENGRERLLNHFTWEVFYFQKNKR